MIADQSEFAFIAGLRDRFGAGEGVEVGLGDDAAVVTVGGARVLFTTDMLVEGVHFDFALSRGREVGHKALVASVSDIAAMGGRPRSAVVSVAMPAGIDTGAVVDGIEDAAREYGVSIVGGDTTRGPVLVISVALIGETVGEPILRSTARAGDLLCLTGTAGDAAAGLAILKNDEAARTRYPAACTAYTLGRARLREGTAAARAGVTAMIDVSDGVGADAHHLAAESGLGLVVAVENVPLSDELRKAAAEHGFDAHRLAMSGGEDYELLMAIHPHDVDVLRDVVAPTQLTVIGEFATGDQRVARWPDGSQTSLKDLGWDHFA